METKQERKNPPLRTVVGMIAILGLVAAVGIYADMPAESFDALAPCTAQALCQ